MSDLAKAGKILIREDTLLPKGLQLETQPYAPGWRLVKNFDGHSLGRKIEEAGWTFFLLAGHSNVTVFGFDEEKTVRRAVERILANPRLKNFNALEITRVSSAISKRFLGVTYVTLSAHSRHIQESVFLSRDSDIQEWDRENLAMPPEGRPEGNFDSLNL